MQSFRSGTVCPSPPLPRAGVGRASVFALGLAALLAFAITMPLRAQEVLSGLHENARVPEQGPARTKAAAVVLELPFVDDFAKPTNLVPDPLLWEGSNSVFVNNTFAIAPPTVGVATFDPFDHTGRIYPQASSRVFAADTLCSRPINLALPNDSIYLSFLYQPQGYGDLPEADDTLSLEFYSPLTQTWTPVWSASVQLRDSTILERDWLRDAERSIAADGLGTKFYRAHLKVDRAAFLASGFRFRFINYASIVVNGNVPGRSTASDHWHLDFVYLDRGRSAGDLNLPDIAISVPQASFSKRYEAIPATHLNTPEAQNDLFDDPQELKITYTNLGIGVRSVGRNFRISPIRVPGFTVSYNGGSENINNGETITFSYLAPRYEFRTYSDAAAFEVRGYITTDTEDTPLRRALRHNDTTRFVQSFSDYYAYDDGSAENGYGLFGAGTSNGQLAVKFFNFKQDSLRGVYIYFNRAVNEANQQAFKVAVWDDDGAGRPGRLLHVESGAKPVFRDSLNQFVPYRFAKPVLLGKSTNFFVGWIQSTEDFLNVGFDRNRDRREQAYYNIGAGWEQSAIAGAIMLRPIFTRAAENFPNDYEPLTPPADNRSKARSYLAYPNPTRGGVLHLDENDHTPLEASRVELYNLMGGLERTYSKVNSKIDLSTVEPGMYLLRVWNNGQAREVKRIVVAK